MAAATASNAGFNIRTQASHPIRLGDSFTKPSEYIRYTSVRYNYKPSTKSPNLVEARIDAKNGGDISLSFRDEGGQYTYSGRDVDDGESYILFMSGPRKDQELLLERVDSFGFDVTKTPTESSASQLAKRYPHLPVAQDDENDDDLFGDEDESAPLDEDNPFDFRHFLKAELEKLESSSSNADASRAIASTSQSRPQAPKAKAATKSAKRPEPKKASTTTKRKPAAAAKPNPKRVKAGQEVEVGSVAAAKAKVPTVPELRMDRKASIRRPSIDDSGELILENENPADDRLQRQPSAMSLALSGQLAQGPISLHSAASSPASHNASPMPVRPAEMEKEYEFDLGDSSPDTSQAADDEDVEPEPEVAEDGDGDDDADVEELELTSPVYKKTATHEIDALPPPPGGDDDDDLDKQLALAMAEAESDEESEEE